MKADAHPRHTETARYSKITAILSQMAAVLRDMKMQGPNGPGITKSLRGCLAQLTPFLQQNDSLTLLVQENALVHGDRVVYSSAERRDSLAFALFRDGLRILTFRAGVTHEEIEAFVSALHEASQADPHKADLVTILWEKDLTNITYQSVDAHLSDAEHKRTEGIVAAYAKRAKKKIPRRSLPDSTFFTNEIGISPPENGKARCPEPEAVSDPDLRTLIYEMLDEDDQTLLKRCSEICMEIAHTTTGDELFTSVVDFLGKTCEWLVSSGDFVWASTILSDLRSTAGEENTSAKRRAHIMDTVARLGEKRKILRVTAHFHDLTESRIEEIYGYLVRMAPVAVEPLCELLSEAQERAVRYLLCRVLSTIGRSNPAHLKRFILDKRWYVARNMVLILGMMETPESIAILKRALPHPEARVRKELARALGRIRSPEGLELLGALLDDEDRSVRLAAIKSTREIGADAALEVFHDAIKHKNFRKRPLDERKEIAIAYGSLGPGSFDLLVAILEGKVHRWDKKTRACAAYGLARINNDEALDFLKTLTEKGKGPIRYAAAEAFSSAERLSTRDE